MTVPVALADVGLIYSPMADHYRLCTNCKQMESSVLAGGKPLYIPVTPEEYQAVIDVFRKAKG